MNVSLDWSFYNWDLISNFVIKGLGFSLMLTVIATLGGLFIARGYLAKMGGAIAVRNADGGVIFTLSLPRAT